MSAFRLRFVRRGTPTPTPTPTPSSGTLYDTSIGLGVDTNGRADLTPRAGAKIFYVNPSTGSDSNTSTQAQSAATPLATVAKAVSYVTDGAGDHVLLAEGQTFSRGLALLRDYGGYSPVYPMVIQSYDATDPTNQAKWGTATGSNRPIVVPTGADMVSGFIQGNGVKKYRAFRGLKFDSGNTASVVLNIFPGSPGSPDYFLAENCEFAQTGIAIGIYGGNTITCVIFRNCSFHGQYGANISDHQQGIFTDTVTGFTAEDCAFWHCGWKESATRATDPTLGGPTIYNHPLYLYDTTRDTIFRRNVSVDNSNDGGNFKGGGVVSNNLFLNNPNIAAGASGNTYSTDRPAGMEIEIAYNVGIGGGSVTTGTGPLDWGYAISAGAAQGSAVHHNVAAWSSAKAGNAFLINAQRDDNNGILDCYCDFHHNVSSQWTNSGSTFAVGTSNTAGPDLGRIHQTFTNNTYDDPTSGSNTNVGSVTLANAYTVSGLITALGYADLPTALAAWMAHPEQHGWRSGVSMGLTGYNIAADTTAPNLTSPTHSSVTSTTATVGVTTNKLSGKLHVVLSTSNSTPTDVQIRGRKDSTGIPAIYQRLQVLQTGALSFAITGLTTATTYYPYFVQEDAAGNVSSVVAGASFTTS